MKTLRDTLLHRHQAANTRLDQVRQTVLRTSFPGTKPSLAVPTQGSKPTYANLAVTLWQELIRPSRYIWGALAALWLVLLAIDLELREPHPKGATPVPVLSGVAAPQTFVEQRRVLAELLQSPNPAPADRPTPEPQPRSEGTTSWPHRIGRAPGARNVQAIA